MCTDIFIHFHRTNRTPSRMKLIVVVILWCLCNCVIGNQSTQQRKLESLKSLIINNAKATVKLNSTDLKQLLSLSKSTSGNGGTAFSSRRIGFYATLRSSNNYGKRQTVIFDNILINDGSGYDDRTGVFTCPVAGTYMFVLDALVSQRTTLSLKINKKKVAMLYVKNPLNRYEKRLTFYISRTVLLKLKRSDHVKVVSEYGDGFLSSYYSGFIGTFLY